MSEYRKADTDQPYFLTLTVVGWIDVFTRYLYAEEIIRNLQYCQQQKGLRMFAYVIMPSHLHMVARIENGKMSDFLRDFKSYTAKRLLQRIEQDDRESRKDWLLHTFRFFARYQKQNREYQFWQKTNFPVVVDTPSLIDQKINYIHNNPVKARIVKEPHHYYYSSAHPDSPLAVIRP